MKKILQNFTKIIPKVHLKPRLSPTPTIFFNIHYIEIKKLKNREGGPTLQEILHYQTKSPTKILFLNYMLFPCSPVIQYSVTLKKNEATISVKLCKKVEALN